MSEPRLVFDLDGVLADFTSAALARLGADVPRPDVRWGTVGELAAARGGEPPFWGGLDRPFWAGLGPCEDGLELFRLLRGRHPDLDVSVCTAPPEGCFAAAAAGKIDWVKTRLGLPPSRVLFAVEKWRAAAPPAILIDDKAENVIEFRRAGGRAVLVPRPWNVRRADCRPDGHSFDAAAVAGEVSYHVEAVRLAGRTASWGLAR